MKKTLIIARHGNTFLPEQTPTRVGRGTDLPLVEEKRGRAIGKYLLSKDIIPTKVYAAPLKRTMQTAALALEEMRSGLSIISADQFTEIDYGPDENRTEEEVKLRLGSIYMLDNSVIDVSYEEKINQGKVILQKWDTDGTVPNGWIVDINSIIDSWNNLANSIEDEETILICSSNGIIRFAPHILALPYDAFCSEYDIKVATGSVSIFEYQDHEWVCKEWNAKPYNLF